MIALDFPNAVTSEARFYGRQQELNQIQATLETNQRVPVVVIGERRVGKTSIHGVAIERLKARSSEAYTPLIIEPRGVQSVDQFVEAILSRLSTHTKSDLRNSGLVHADGRVHLETADQLDEAFFRLSVDHVSLTGQGAAGRYLLCVDEFDELIRIAGEAGDAERMKLMGVIHHLVEKTEIPLSLFLTMTRLPEGASREIASPLLGKCEVIELRPFPFDDLVAMVVGLVDGQTIFSDQDLVWLYRISGGHPYMAKLLLANLFKRVEALRGSPMYVDMGKLTQALYDAVDDPRAHYAFENIYRVHWNADEKRVILYLAERNELVDIGEFRVAGASLLTAARNLEKRYYLVESDGAYQLKAAFLGHWLRNWAEFDEEIERLRVHRIGTPWLDGETAVHEGADKNTSEDDERSR